jgi:hypothetical protein
VTGRFIGIAIASTLIALAMFLDCSLPYVH